MASAGLAGEELRRLWGSLAKRVRTLAQRLNSVRISPTRVSVPREESQIDRNQRLLDDKLYDYVTERDGEMSPSQAEKDLGVAVEQIQRSAERLCTTGRLSRSYYCVHCSAEISPGSNFCGTCGEPQGQQTGIGPTPTNHAFRDSIERPHPAYDRKSQDIYRQDKRMQFSFPRPFSKRPKLGLSGLLTRAWNSAKPRRALDTGARQRLPQKPFERTKRMPPQSMRICRKCRRLLRPAGSGRWYCDRCGRYA